MISKDKSYSYLLVFIAISPLQIHLDLSFVLDKEFPRRLHTPNRLTAETQSQINQLSGFNDCIIFNFIGATKSLLLLLPSYYPPMQIRTPERQHLINQFLKFASRTQYCSITPASLVLLLIVANCYLLHPLGTSNLLYVPTSRQLGIILFTCLTS